MQTSRVTAGHSTVRQTVSQRAGMSMHTHAGSHGGGGHGGGGHGAGGQPSPANAAGVATSASTPTNVHAKSLLLMGTLLLGVFAETSGPSGVAWRDEDVRLERTACDLDAEPTRAGGLETRGRSSLIAASGTGKRTRNAPKMHEDGVSTAPSPGALERRCIE